MNITQFKKLMEENGMEECSFEEWIEIHKSVSFTDDKGCCFYFKPKETYPKYFGRYEVNRDGTMDFEIEGKIHFINIQDMEKALAESKRITGGKA